MNPAGLRVVVTGGASGIGLAFARRLRELGSRVAIVDRDVAALAAVGEEWPRAAPASSGDCVAWEGDVGIEADVTRVVEGVVASFGGIDVLINNAAVLRDQALVSKLGKRVKKHSTADWDETLRSNLTGPFLMAREVAASMIERRLAGLVVNVSSISRAGNPGQTAYAASKAALVAMTATWAQELAPHRIRVVAIAPGFVETGMTKAIPPMFLERIRELTPLKRFGTLDEFASAIQFVVENDYLNGKTLELDGGLRF